MSRNPKLLAARFPFMALVVAMAAGAFAPPALARDAYVPNYGSKSVSVIDMDSNTVVKTISVGNNPSSAAITPDGKTVYVTEAGDNDVVRIKTARNEVVGEPIDVGTNPIGVAVTPNGSKVLVANNLGATISVIDTTKNKVKPEAPLTGAASLYAVAVEPDGDRAWAMSYGTDQIFPFEPGTGASSGSATNVGQKPSTMAFTPGGTGYVANSIDGNVSVINASGAVVGSPIAVGSNPQGIAVAPVASRAYASNGSTVGKVTVIDTSTNATVGSPISTGGDYPRGLAVTPSGGRVYVANASVGSNPGSVSVIDTSTNATVGSPISVGIGARTVAIVPNQPPKAQFDVTLRGDPNTMTTFDAGFSTDPDGTVVRYDWGYGDGTLDPNAGSVPAHVYDRPGKYEVTVTETDNEGCSTTVVYTGQTASCGGTDAAVATKTVKISFPKVKLKCKGSSHGKCKVTATALTKKNDGEKASRPASAKIKPGKSKKVHLKIDSGYAADFAVKESAFVQIRAKAGGKTSTSVKKLQLIR